MNEALTRPLDMMISVVLAMEQPMNILICVIVAIISMFFVEGCCKRARSCRTRRPSQEPVIMQHTEPVSMQHAEPEPEIIRMPARDHAAREARDHARRGARDDAARGARDHEGRMNAEWNLTMPVKTMWQHLVKICVMKRKWSVEGMVMKYLKNGFPQKVSWHHELAKTSKGRGGAWGYREIRWW